MLLAASAIVAAGLALYKLPGYADPKGAILIVSPYGVAALSFAAAAWAFNVDATRGRLFAVGGAILLASWTVAIGYGPSEIPTRTASILGGTAALAALIGTRPRWAMVAIATLGAAGAALSYLLLTHPPLALLAIYAIAAVGLSAAEVALLPVSVRRWPVVALVPIALGAWLVAAVVLLLAFGPPLVAS